MRQKNKLVIFWNGVKTISSVKFFPPDKMVGKAAIRLIATIKEFQKSPVFSVQPPHEL